MIWYQHCSIIGNDVEELRWRSVAAFPNTAKLMTLPEFMKECAKNPTFINDVVFNGTFANHVDYIECARIFNVLPQLRRLALVNTQVVRFAIQPNTLFRLTDLSITCCNCFSLPGFLWNLGPSLKSLDLSKNFFSDLPEQISNSAFRLRKLVLRKNRFFACPKVVSSLKELRHLDLSLNQLVSLESMADAELKNLTSLDISGNTELKVIPKEVIELPALKVLDATDARSLTCPPYSLAKQGVNAMKKYYATRKRAAGWLTFKPRTIA